MADMWNATPITPHIATRRLAGHLGVLGAQWALPVALWLFLGDWLNVTAINANATTAIGGAWWVLCVGAFAIAAVSTWAWITHQTLLAGPPPIPSARDNRWLAIAAVVELVWLLSGVAVLACVVAYLPQ